MGLALTFAINLVADPSPDFNKWLIAGSTFTGFAYGLYHVSRRPKPGAAFIHYDEKGFARIAVPEP